MSLTAATKLRLACRASLRRSYATRLPERPPHRAPDPLNNNPNAVYQELPEDLTFIHRPPPTVPTPFSYTSSPSSPLLKSAPATSDDSLPPALHPERGQPEPVSREDILRIRELRAEDPEKWTRTALAKEFNCTPGFIGKVAALAPRVRKVALAKRDAEHEEARSKWGEKKTFLREVTKKRREFW